MALVSCRECGNKVSTDSKNCPACGAVMKRKMPLWRKALIAIIGAVVVVNVLNGLGKSGERSASATTKTSPQTASSASYGSSAPFVETFQSSASPVASGPRWEESVHKDEMTDKSSKVFHLLSSDSLRLEFPYGGNNMGHLYVRFPDAGKPDAYLLLDKGNLICGYRDCYMMVRFDDGKAQRFNATKADDHSSNVLFFSDANRFIAAARKAKKILVEVQFFQQGNQVVKFEPAEPLK